MLAILINDALMGAIGKYAKCGLAAMHPRNVVHCNRAVASRLYQCRATQAWT
jgi:hypothetical protein